MDQGTSNASTDNTDSDRAPRPLSPTKLLPFLSHLHRLQSDAELEALRRRLQHAPRPLKKRSSITEPEGPGGPNIQKLLYQKATLAAMEMPEATTGAANDTGTISADVERREEEDVHAHLLPPHGSIQEESRGDELVDDELLKGRSVPEEYPPYPPPPYPNASKQGGQDVAEDRGNKAPEVTGQITLPVVHALHPIIFKYFMIRTLFFIV